MIIFMPKTGRTKVLLPYQCYLFLAKGIERLFVAKELAVCVFVNEGGVIPEYTNFISLTALQNTINTEEQFHISDWYLDINIKILFQLSYDHEGWKIA